MAEDLAKKPTVDGLCGCGDAVHVAVCVMALTAVRLPAAPNLPAYQTVELVFAPLQSVPSVPVAQAESPTPPVVPETPAPPPEQPVSAEPPPLAEAPAPTETLVPPEPPAAAAVIPSPPEPPPPQTAKPSRHPFGHPSPKSPLRGPRQFHRRVVRTRRPHLISRPTSRHPDRLVRRSHCRRLAAFPSVMVCDTQNLSGGSASASTEGSAVLRFTADRTGRVLNVVLVRSAGSSILDAAAEFLMGNATLPPFTSGMT